MQMTQQQRDVLTEQADYTETIAHSERHLTHKSCPSQESAVSFWEQQELCGIWK